MVTSEEGIVKYESGGELTLVHKKIISCSTDQMQKSINVKYTLG